GGAMAASPPKLYVLPGSHPCAAAEGALRLKGIAFRRVDLLPMVPVIVGPTHGAGPAPRRRARGGIRADNAPARRPGQRPAAAAGAGRSRLRTGARGGALGR